MLPINLDPLSIFMELLFIFLIVNSFLNRKNALNANLFIYTFLATLIVISVQLLIPVPAVIVLTSQLVCFLIEILHYKLEIQKTVLCHLFSNFILAIISIPMLIFLKNFEQLQALPIIFGIYLLISGILISMFIPWHKIFDCIYRQPLVVYLLLVNVSILLLFVLLYIQIKSNNSYENIIILSCVAIVIIAVNMVQYSSYIKSKEKEKRLELLEEYMPILDEMIISIRERQHNYNNQLQAIRALPYTHKTYEQLEKALLGSETKNLFESTPVYLLKTNLTIVAGYLYKKSIDANKGSKNLIIILEDFDLPTKLSQYEIIEILGILIDNALEAIPEESSAKIIISRDEDKLIIKTFNQGPIVDSGFIKSILTPGYTTKTIESKGEHGLGLPRLKAFLDDHNGKLLIKNETINETRNIVFVVEV